MAQQLKMLAIPVNHEDQSSDLRASFLQMSLTPSCRIQWPLLAAACAQVHIPTSVHTLMQKL